MTDYSKLTNNGTPFTDEDWKKWYRHKSNKERFIEEEEEDDNRGVKDLKR